MLEGFRGAHLAVRAWFLPWLMISAPHIAVAQVSASTVDFQTAPASTIEKITRHCMDKGTVIESTATQVKCETTLSFGDQLYIHRITFDAQGEPRDVHRYTTYTVVREGRGSKVQVREWVTAQVRGVTRTSESDPKKEIESLTSIERAGE